MRITAHLSFLFDFLSNLAILPIRFYQRIISPLLPDSCRYVPSCSVYAEFSIKKYGAFKGSWMAFRRILRCNPLYPGGYDPVE